MSIPVQVHHISVTADAIASAQPGGRIFFLPGSISRAHAIAEHFKETRNFPSPRGHDVIVGTYDGIDVGVVPTGMGTPSLDIIVNELIALGATNFLRVGTAGGMLPNIEPGHLVVASAAVRDDGTSDNYVPDGFPAIPSQRWCSVLRTVACEPNWNERVHEGIVHTKRSLIVREFGQGPRSDESERYMTMLRELGVVASEMEAAHLFVLGSVFSAQKIPVHTGCVLAIIGGVAQPFVDQSTIQQANEDLIAFALESATRFRTSL